jgi:hypothetical protein
LAKRGFECPKCKSVFSFEEGILCASKYGIQGSVLMCEKCHSVFSSDGVLTSGKLTVDLTGQFDEEIKKYKPSAAVKPAPVITPQVSFPVQQATRAPMPVEQAPKAPMTAEQKRLVIFGGLLLAVVLIIILLSVFGPEIGRLFNS